MPNVSLMLLSAHMMMPPAVVQNCGRNGSKPKHSLLLLPLLRWPTITDVVHRG
jgi:hypothetical protein